MLANIQNQYLQRQKSKYQNTSNTSIPAATSQCGFMQHPFKNHATSKQGYCNIKFIHVQHEKSCLREINPQPGHPMITWISISTSRINHCNIQKITATPCRTCRPRISSRRPGDRHHLRVRGSPLALYATALELPQQPSRAASCTRLAIAGDWVGVASVRRLSSSVWHGSSVRPSRTSWPRYGGLTIAWQGPNCGLVQAGTLVEEA